MKRMTRREVLASLGLAGGAGLVSGCGPDAQSSPADQGGGSQSDRWPYVELEPELVAGKAYELFPDGGCMYGLTGGIINALGDEIGEPYRSFPVEMMRYGEGGIAGWGSICGTLNGAAAVIGLLYATKQSGSAQLLKELNPWDSEKPEWHRLVDEVFRWYENAELPTYQPENASGASDVPSSVAGSVLCHVSLSNWCEASGNKAFGPWKVERCRRLTANVAMKTVEVLNEGADGLPSGDQPTPEATSCMKCHGKKGQGDAMGKMNCSACHTLPDKHPEQ
mgnify:CR=1 FL=1